MNVRKSSVKMKRETMMIGAVTCSLQWLYGQFSLYKVLQVWYLAEKCFLNRELCLRCILCTDSEYNLSSLNIKLLEFEKLEYNSACREYPWSEFTTQGVFRSWYATFLYTIQLKQVTLIRWIRWPFSERFRKVIDTNLLFYSIQVESFASFVQRYKQNKHW